MQAEHRRRAAESFARRVKQGDTWSEVYCRCLMQDFDAIATSGGRRTKSLYHPQGESLPSLNQFRHAVVVAYGIDAVQREMLGRTRVRNRLRAPIGKFSAMLSKLLERVEADVYVTEDHPRGFLDDKQTLPKLAVARLRCGLSGALVGIGFTCGPERNDAYRVALFCAAVPKNYFCSLFGLQISADDWPCVGLSPTWITDRGPGAKLETMEIASTRQKTPSYQPRSKSGIESSNPHSKKLEGAPTYVISDLNPPQMAVREIVQLLRDNDTMDMSDRMTPEMIREGVLQVPIEIWNFMACRGRSAAVSMSIEDAVRTFLNKVELTVKDDGVWLSRLRYNSTELQQTGLFDRIRVGGQTKIMAYVLELCVRVIWVEFEGRLYQVECQSPHRTDEGQYFISLPEVMQMEEAMSTLRSELVEHRQAVRVDWARRFESAVGKKIDGGKRVRGRPSKTRRAQAELTELSRQAGRKTS